MRLLRCLGRLGGKGRSDGLNVVFEREVGDIKSW